MPGPVAIWAALQSAVLETFSPYSPYGAPALGGALMFSAFYYASRRQARGRECVAALLVAHHRDGDGGLRQLLRRSLP